MPKSKRDKNHKERLAKYKAKKKVEQEFLKKKMIDNYMKMQQQMLADSESHTSTEEVIGPDIDIEGLNQVEGFETEQNIDLSNLNILEENINTISLETGQILDAEIKDVNIQ